MFNLKITCFALKCPTTIAKSLSNKTQKKKEKKNKTIPELLRSEIFHFTGGDPEAGTGQVI